MPSMTNLSTEVICLIMNNIPFSSHFDFACVCRMIAAASQHVLWRRQKAYNAFRIVSDKDPTTVPLLLQSALGRTSL